MIEEIFDPREWISILDGFFVQGSVVGHKAPFRGVFLGNNEGW
jgi:hypothetical protein